MNRILVRHCVRSGGCGLEHKKRLLPGIEQRSLGRPNRSLFPILTELHRIPLMKVNNGGILIQKRCKFIYLVLPVYFVLLFEGCFAPNCLATDGCNTNASILETQSNSTSFLIGFFDIKFVSQQPLIWRRCETVCLCLYVQTDRIRP